MAETYNIYFGTESGNLTLIDTYVSDLSIVVPVSPLAYNTVYYWRVDARNDEGTTTGDEWRFTTLVFDPPVFIASGSTGFGSDGGPTAKRLVACANNKVWYESI